MPVSKRPYNPPPRYQDPVTHCLWCGAKLVNPKDAVYEDVYIPETGGKYPRKVGTKPRYSKPGFHGNGFFCSAGCGLEFALAYARYGSRLGD